jgi:hypothetical protein
MTFRRPARRTHSEPSLSRSIRLGDQTVAFELVRADRTTVGIRVRPDGSVVVRAPRRTREADVLRQVTGHADWILRTRCRLAEAERRRRRRYEDGEAHLYLGRPYLLTIERAGDDGAFIGGHVGGHGVDVGGDAAAGPVRLLGDTMTVTLDGDASAERIGELLDAWYEEEARRVLPKRLAVCWTAVGPALHTLHRASGSQRSPAGTRGTPAVPALRIKRMRSRWGSMSPKGAMSLRLDLVRAPVECIDYVIVHELCHLVHPHHQPAFWALVEQLMPDWKRRRRRLHELLP